MTENMLFGKAQFPKKEEVLKVLDGLTYSERRTIAQKFGKEYGGRPGFDEFLQEIRDHSPPAIPVVHIEEDGEDGGLEEILPPQKRNVSKHIHEEYFALFAAGTANKNKIFQDEIRYTVFRARWITFFLVNRVENQNEPERPQKWWPFGFVLVFNSAYGNGRH